MSEYHECTFEQDVRCATLLSELVYKAADAPDEAAFRQAQVRVEEAVGASLSNVRCHKSGGQRFLVGETEDAIYVAFQGTKSAIDWLANLNFFHGQFSWQHHQHLSSSSSSVSSRSSSVSSTSSTSSCRSRSSRAHIGFLKRANSAAVSISELHAAAAAAGKRLVLTGHSLGGAVAVLTTVRLLRSLTTEQARGNSSAAAARAGLTLSLDLSEPNVRCISFATPAMANSDLLQEVTAAGWDQYITNIVMPEDPVVPFVNLLLKAPPSPTQPPAISPSTFFAGLDSPSSISSSSSVAAETSSLLTRSNSWGSGLTFEPSVVAEDLSTSLAAADPIAAVGGWLGSATAAAAAVAAADLAMAHAAADSTLLPTSTSTDPAVSSTSAVSPPVPPVPSVLQESTGSQELASWLAAARDAVKHQAGSQPSQCSFRDSSRCNSASGDSLCSLTSDAFGQWPASSSADDYSSSSRADSPAVFSEASVSPVGRSGYTFGVPVVASWALETSSSLVFSSDGSSGGGSAASAADSQQQKPQQKEVAVAAAGATAVAAAAVLTQQQQQQQQQEAGPSSQPRANLGAQLAQQLRRIQQQLASTKVGRLAWISGAIAAGARCASALAAPAAAASAPHLSLLALLPRALAGPAALAVLHFVGHAAYQAALPPSHPLGQQWVMTGSGLEPVAKPLTSYPRTGEGLGLKELGGLFPGHRMIAYRRRLANLVSQSPASTAAADPVQQQ